MYPWFPDVTSSFDEPGMLAVRRHFDLILSVHDHVEEGDLPEPEEDSGNTHFTIGFDADSGYVLRIELRQRGHRVVSGFTLVEEGYGLHSPMLRATRAIDGPWRLRQLNVENATSEMVSLVRSFDIEKPGVRYAATDYSVNILFGKCCQMMVYGFVCRH